MSPVPKDIDTYLAELPQEQQSPLQQLRQTIRRVAPEAAESISYRIPTFRYKGRSLIYFGAAKSHLALYGSLGSVIEAHREELRPYVTSKGTIRFPADKPIPGSLVKKLVKAQMKEIEAGTSVYGKKGGKGG